MTPADIAKLEAPPNNDGCFDTRRDGVYWLRSGDMGWCSLTELLRWPRYRVYCACVALQYWRMAHESTPHKSNCAEMLYPEEKCTCMDSQISEQLRLWNEFGGFAK